MLGRDVGRYVEDYRRYFGEQAAHATEAKTMLDPAPRVVLDPGFGMAWWAGRQGRRNRRGYLRAYDRSHTESRGVGRVPGLARTGYFEVEYWDLEQAKLRRAAGLPYSPVKRCS